MLLVAALAWPYFGVHDIPLPWGLLAVATGALAGALAWITRQRSWWVAIHALFLPLAWFTNSLDIPPGWFLLAFLSLWVIFRGAVSGRVPLYLSNRSTADALIALATEQNSHSLVDLGAGIGSILRRFIAARPQLRCVGIENAPLTWLIGRLNLGLHTPAKASYHWQFGSLWDYSLADFDLVYCFLSSEPMPDLWEKAKQEMRPGTLLVSNSFPIPDIPPSKIINVTDRRATVLYCYQL